MSRKAQPGRCDLSRHVRIMERQEDSARFMTAHGYVVAGNDTRGHEKSVVSKEDWGYFASRDGYRLLLHTDTEGKGSPSRAAGFFVWPKRGFRDSALLLQRSCRRAGRSIFSAALVQKRLHMSAVIVHREVKKYGPKGVSQLL